MSYNINYFYYFCVCKITNNNANITNRKLKINY